MNEHVENLLIVVGFLSLFLLVMAAATLLEEDHVPVRGIFWRAVPRALSWAWIGMATIASLFLPPARRPRKTRHELEQRIAELEKEVDL